MRLRSFLSGTVLSLLQRRQEEGGGNIWTLRHREASQSGERCMARDWSNHTFRGLCLKSAVVAWPGCSVSVGMAGWKALPSVSLRSKGNKNGSGVEEGKKKRKTSKYYSGIFSWEGNTVSSSGKKETEGVGALLLRKAGSLGKALL